MNGMRAAPKASDTRNAISSMVIGSLHSPLQIQPLTENLTATIVGGVGKLVPNARQRNSAGGFEEALPGQRFFRWRYLSRLQHLLPIQLIDRPLRLRWRRIRRWLLLQRVWLFMVRHWAYFITTTLLSQERPAARRRLSSSFRSCRPAKVSEPQLGRPAPATALPN